MNFFDKIHNLYLDTLEHHDTISIDFSHSNETRKDIMYIVQYHSMVEGFCKRMLEYFCKHIEYAIQKNINRYRNISIIFYRNKNSNNNIIKDPDLLNLNLDTDWIKKKIIDYPLLKNFQLKDGEFEFLFSFFASQQKIYHNGLDVDYRYFSAHIKDLNLWRNDIVHDYCQSFLIPSIPRRLDRILKDKAQKEKFSAENKHLIQFIYEALKQECH